MKSRYFNYFSTYYLQKYINRKARNNILYQRLVYICYQCPPCELFFVRGRKIKFKFQHGHIFFIVYGSAPLWPGLSIRGFFARIRINPKIRKNNPKKLGFSGIRNSKSGIRVLCFKKSLSLNFLKTYLF